MYGNILPPADPYPHSSLPLSLLLVMTTLGALTWGTHLLSVTYSAVAWRWPIILNPPAFMTCLIIDTQPGCHLSGHSHFPQMTTSQIIQMHPPIKYCQRHSFFLYFLFKIMTTKSVQLAETLTAFWKSNLFAATTHRHLFLCMTLFYILQYCFVYYIILNYYFNNLNILGISSLHDWSNFCCYCFTFC